MDKVARWLRRPRANPWWFDSALALAIAGLNTAFFVFHPEVRGLPRGMFVLGCGLVLLHTLPLAARRRFPLAVLAASVASGLAFTVLDLPPDLLWLVVAEVGLVANQLTPGRFQAPTVVGNALFIGAAWLLGHFVGVRRLYVLQLEERTAELERAREELARRAVVEERLRLARELHDVVAHAMSVIAVQSGVGAHVANTQPKEAAKALVAIEATSRAALEELRRLLGVLRQADEPQGDLAPVPGLANLDVLLTEVSKAGLAVKLQVNGTQPQLPAGVDLSAYRIVQEALTNVVKHAGPARAQVVVGYGDQEVTVEVIDDGRGAVTSVSDGRVGTGHGLIGMRERVQAFGGDLEAGPRPGGGFRVAARLPLAADRR
jgi:signal transduction histidine kinase